MKTLKRAAFYLMFAAATAVAPVWAEEPASTKETAGEYLDDTVITTKVKAALLGDTQLKLSEINVETYKGTVQLSGFVSSEDKISRAGDLASTVKGVKSIKNDIRLK